MRSSEPALRGRGGAGFPTWRKWDTCRQTAAEQRYLICNADEGDPGAFMNRSLIEGDPHAVLEGMLIAAFALGASKGYVYCRAEYPLAHRPPRRSPSGQMRDLGLLGENIQGSGFSFDVEIKKGAGRVRLRRGDRADRLDRGPPRHAAAAAALPRRRAACGASRRSSRTSRPSRTCR